MKLPTSVKYFSLILFRSVYPRHLGWSHTYPHPRTYPRAQNVTNTHPLSPRTGKIRTNLIMQLLEGPFGTSIRLTRLLRLPVAMCMYVPSYNQGTSRAHPVDIKPLASEPRIPPVNLARSRMVCTYTNNSAPFSYPLHLYIKIFPGIESFPKYSNELYLQQKNTAFFFSSNDKRIFAGSIMARVNWILPRISQTL